MRMRIDRLSILVPFKNEQEALSLLLSKLSELSFGEMDVEVILVNDHSTDQWKSSLPRETTKYCLTILNLPEGTSGKKAACHLGISAAKYPWVLTLDADVKPSDELFVAIRQQVPQGSKYCLVPLSANRVAGFTRAFFDLEFLALHFVGLKSTSLRRPLLSNAACSVIEKSAYLETAKTRTDWNVLSGDDMFAMFAISSLYGSQSIGTLDLSLPLVRVNFPNDLKSLFIQRLRWAGKSHKIKNTWFTQVAMITLLFNLVFAIGLVSLFKQSFPLSILMLVIFQIAIQFFLLKRVSEQLKRKDLLKWILTSILIYPFYLLALVCTQFFWQPKWK